MGKMKIAVAAFSMVQELSESSGVELTNEMGYDDFFKSCVEEMKLRIEKLQLKTVIRLINFLESETEPLAEWEKEVLAVLYRRKSVSLCV